MQASEIYASPEAVPSEVAVLLVAQFGAHAAEPTLAAVFTLTDEARFVSHRCVVNATGEQLSIVVASFGDTQVGLGVRNGRKVAELNDGFLSAV